MRERREGARERWEKGERQMRGGWEKGERRVRERWEVGERGWRGAAGGLTGYTLAASDMMTFPSAERLALIHCVSLNRSPSDFDSFSLSEPARSTRLSVPAVHRTTIEYRHTDRWPLSQALESLTNTSLRCDCVVTAYLQSEDRVAARRPGVTLGLCYVSVLSGCFKQTLHLIKHKNACLISNKGKN